MALLGFSWFCVDSCIPGTESLSPCGSLKSGAATPLTNLYSDAGVGRLEAWMPGCLDIWYLGGFMCFCLDLGGFRWISWTPGAEGLSTCGGLKSGAATPLTNLYSDAGVGRMPGCLDIWYSGGFICFCLDLGGFRWISWIPGAGGLSTCGALKREAATLAEGLSTCGSLKNGAATPLTNLYSDAGVGGLEAWMPGCLDDDDEDDAADEDEGGGWRCW